MAAKLALILPLICALTATSFAGTVPQDAETVPQDAGTVPQDADGVTTIPEITESVDMVASAKESAAATSAATSSAIPPPPPFPPKPLSDTEDILTIDQWPEQVFSPMKEATIKREPVEVVLPSTASAQVPCKFTNQIKYNDFSVSDDPVEADQRCEYYSGTYDTGESGAAVMVKKAIPGFENILLQEAEVMAALADKPSFPQLINFDGRNLTMTSLCSTWSQYTAVQFQAGGMDLEDGYNMMHQMLDALKDMHSRGYVHRDVSANNIAFGCYYHKDIPEIQAPFRLSETSKLYLHEFGSTENVVESTLNKYYFFAGTWDFVSNATMHDEDPMFVQDCESLGYVLLYGLNGGFLSWTSDDGTINLEDNIAKKAALDLNENLDKMKGDEKTIAKAKRDITKFFTLVREHTKNRPTELLDYEALKACFNVNEQ